MNKEIKKSALNFALSFEKLINDFECYEDDDKLNEILNNSYPFNEPIEEALDSIKAWVKDILEGEF